MVVERPRALMGLRRDQAITGHVTLAYAASGKNNRKSGDELAETHIVTYLLGCRVAGGSDQNIVWKRLRPASSIHCPKGRIEFVSQGPPHLISFRLRNKLFRLTVFRFRKCNCCSPFCFRVFLNFARYAQTWFDN